MYISKMVNLYLLVCVAVMNAGLTYVSVSSESWWKAGMYGVVIIIIVYFFYRDLKNHSQGRQYRLVQERIHELFDELTEGDKNVRATELLNGITYFLFYQPRKRTGFLKFRSPEIRWVVEADNLGAFSPDEKYFSIVRELGFRALGSVTYGTKLVGFDENSEGEYHESSSKLSMKEFIFLMKTPAAMYLSLEEILTLEASLVSIPREDWIEFTP